MRPERRRGRDLRRRRLEGLEGRGDVVRVLRARDVHLPAGDAAGGGPPVVVELSAEFRHAVYDQSLFQEARNTPPQDVHRGACYPVRHFPSLPGVPTLPRA